MAWGLPAEISSMYIHEDVVPLNGNWCVRLRRKGRGCGGLRADLKTGQYIWRWDEFGVEAERR